VVFQRVACGVAQVLQLLSGAAGAARQTVCLQHQLTPCKHLFVQPRYVPANCGRYCGRTGGLCSCCDCALQVSVLRCTDVGTALDAETAASGN
jgi:hypothetical protein